jgi:hypothetical protein
VPVYFFACGGNGGAAQVLKIVSNIRKECKEDHRGLPFIEVLSASSLSIVPIVALERELMPSFFSKLHRNEAGNST